MATQTFEVTEIHCDGCENAIRKALGRLDGVMEVTTHQATNRVDVSYDDTRVDEGFIAERLTTAGYPVVR